MRRRNLIASVVVAAAALIGLDSALPERDGSRICLGLQSTVACLPPG